MGTSPAMSVRLRGDTDERLAMRWLITRRAPHKEAARGLAVYLNGRGTAKVATASGQ
jgi:hypothetical protein